MFELDPAFVGGSEPLAELEVCAARLQNDARFPWLVLIPRVARAVEIEDLNGFDRARLLRDVIRAGQAVRGVGMALGRPVEKLNVGQLGNITRQLHLHVVGRRADDPCWPGPVWGQGTPELYEPEALGVARAAAQRGLAS
ncbi:MAG: HIT domain-containing protein [Caulobacterales bacterium]